MRELWPNDPTPAVFRGRGDDICSTAHWYALSVRHQHERQTRRLLEGQGWESMAPMYLARRQWSDRTKEIEVPLFAGYVFCRFGLADIRRVEDTPGVAHIVAFNGVAAPVEEFEMEQIRCLVSSKLPLSPWPYLKTGDRVRIERGPLRGLEGTLLRDQDRSRFVVSVELLQRSIAAEVDPDTVTPIRAHSAAA